MNSVTAIVLTKCEMYYNVHNAYGQTCESITTIFRGHYSLGEGNERVRI